MVQPKALKKYWAEKNKTKSLGDKCSSCGKSKNRSSTFGAICNKCGKGQV
jgi:uncharacterized OB-fold protein